MRILKEDMKKFRNKMKQFKDDPDKMMKMQKESMEKQMQYMKQSFKPMFITFLPIILIFGWLNANFAFEPITPGEMFEINAILENDISGDVTLTAIPIDGINFDSKQTQTIEDGKVSWNLSGESGEYLLEFSIGEDKVQQDLIITVEQRYAKVQALHTDSPFKQTNIDNDKLVLFKIFGIKVTWLWGYIIFIMIFSSVLRKIFKVH